MSDYSALLDRIRERAQQNFKGDFGDLLQVWWPDSGESVFRVLPPANDDPMQIIMPVGIHYKIGNRKMVFCPKKTGFDSQGECPICDLRDQYYAEGDETSAKKFSCRNRYAMLVLVRGQEEKGPMLFLAPVRVAESIMTTATMSDRFGDVFDPIEGRDFILSRTGEGLSTRYSVTPDGSSRPILPDPDEISDLLEDLPLLSDQITIHTYEELVAIMEGRETEDSTFEKKAKKPLKTKKAVKAPAVAVEETEEKEDEDLPWEGGVIGKLGKPPTREEKKNDDDVAAMRARLKEAMAARRKGSA